MRVTIALLLASIACTKGSGDTETDTDGAADTDVPSSDQDGDTLTDRQEGRGEAVDTDADGVPDFRDEDADGDGLPDSFEAGDADPTTPARDSDGDGTPDFRDTDSDGNGVADGTESGGATDRDGDGDGLNDAYDTDNDGDGLSDVTETSPGTPTDTDGDGTPDYQDKDSDDDGIDDAFERADDTDGDSIPDFRDTDTDGDGLSDAVEGGTATGAGPPVDTDEDGTPDFRDTDSDDDGLLDAGELARGSDPADADSDDDGLSDGTEVAAGTDPLDAASYPAFAVTLAEGETADIEISFDLAVQRADLAFVLDSSCGNDGLLVYGEAAYPYILDDLSLVIPSLASGVAGFDDYAFGSMGSAGYDKPYVVRSPITSDAAHVAAAWARMSVHGGGDGPEAGMEALYQAGTGAGYDQDCDGAYDTLTDVVPFVAAPSDPFGGSGGMFLDTTLADHGTRGGLGFRDASLPILVLVTDNYLRDPEAADSTYNVAPGGCPGDAAGSDVAAAITALGGRLLSVDASGTGLQADQLEALAENTASTADLDGDGARDDALVASIDQMGGAYAASFEAFVEDGVEALIDGLPIDIATVVAPDSAGFVRAISPAYWTGVATGDRVTATVTMLGAAPASSEWQTFLVPIQVIGDGVLVGEVEVVVTVPPR